MLVSVVTRNKKNVGLAYNTFICCNFFCTFFGLGVATVLRDKSDVIMS